MQKWIFFFFLGVRQTDLIRIAVNDRNGYIQINRKILDKVEKVNEF